MKLNMDRIKEIVASGGLPVNAVRDDNPASKSHEIQRLMALMSEEQGRFRFITDSGIVTGTWFSSAYEEAICDFISLSNVEVIPHSGQSFQLPVLLHYLDNVTAFAPV